MSWPTQDVLPEDARGILGQAAPRRRASERTSFGRPDGEVSAIPKVPLWDMAEMLRDGRTLDEVSEVYDLAVSTIGQYLSAAGWSGVTGQPVRRAEPVPRTIPKFTLVFAEQPWTDQAACAETDKDVFFHPERERGQARRSRDIAAKKVCARCFVAAECLDYSLTTGDVYGVFGGLTAEERHILDPSLVNHRSSPHAKTWEPDFDDERTAS